MFKQTVLAIALGMALTSVAYASDTDTDTAATAGTSEQASAAKRDKVQDLDAVSVIGSGEIGRASCRERV